MNREERAAYNRERRERLGLRRFQVEVPQETMRDMETLGELLGTVSRSEIVRRTVAAIAEATIHRDCKVILRDSEGAEREVLFL